MISVIIGFHVQLKKIEIGWQGLVVVVWVFFPQIDLLFRKTIKYLVINKEGI
jgi:hypothetical protein